LTFNPQFGQAVAVAVIMTQALAFAAVEIQTWPGTFVFPII
jgi:hypothetical protein